MEYIYGHMQGIWPLVNLIDAYRQPLEVWQFSRTVDDLPAITVQAPTAILALQAILCHPNMVAYYAFVLPEFWSKNTRVRPLLAMDVERADFPWQTLCTELQCLGVMCAPIIDLTV